MVASATVLAVFPERCTEGTFRSGAGAHDLLAFRGRLCECRTGSGVRRTHSYESSFAQSTDLPVHTIFTIAVTRCFSAERQ